MTTRRLTATLQDLGEQPEAGVTITATLIHDNDFQPRAVQPDVVVPDSVSADTDAQGVAHLDILPAVMFHDPTLQYRLTSSRGTTPHDFLMPDRDITLWEILTSEPPVPPPPGATFVQRVVVGDEMNVSPSSGQGDIRIDVDPLIQRLEADEDELNSRSHIEKGNGPPTRDTPGSSPNDFYWNLDNGKLYQYSIIAARSGQVPYVPILDLVTAAELTAALADADTLPDTPAGDVGTVLGLFRRIRDGDDLTYWSAPRQVPRAGRIGSVLARTGDPNGDDYEFKVLAELIANGTITEAMLTAAVRTKLNASRGGSVSYGTTVQQVAGENMATAGNRDVAARADHVHGLGLTAGGGLAFDSGDDLGVADGGITEAKLAAAVRTKLNATRNQDDTARAAAAAAQLDTDTVIEVGPPLVHNDTTARNLSVNIRHPANAYPTATLMRISAAGQSAVIVGYDHTLLHQDVKAELSSAVLQNIWDQQETIPDGQGGTTRVQAYPVGSYVPIDIQLITGRGGDTVFLRTVDLLVVEAPASAEDSTARGYRITDWGTTGGGANLFLEQADGSRAVTIPTNRIASPENVRAAAQWAQIGAWGNTAGLKDNQVLSVASAGTTVIMRNTMRLPQGVAYNNATGLLTLPLGVWRVTSRAKFAVPGGQRANIKLAQLVDVEGPTAEIEFSASEGYDYRSDPGGSTSLETSAILQVANLGSGNDTSVIRTVASWTGGGVTVNCTSAVLEIERIA